MDGIVDTPNRIIRASAGTGKTFQLSNRYLSLILQGCSPDRILATTFTRKAAGEILSRVLSRLAVAAASDSECQQLSDALAIPLTVSHCQSKLRELTSTLHRVRVGTLDSFFGQVAHSFSLEMGLPPRWEIADAARDALLRGRGIEKLLGDDNDFPEAESAVKLVRMLAKGELKRSVNELLQSAVGDAYELFQASERAAWTGLRRRQESDADIFQMDLEELRTCDCHDPTLSPKKVAMFESKRDEAYQAAVAGDWESLLKRGVMGKIVSGDDTFQTSPIPPALLSALLRLKEHLKNHFVNQTASINESTYTLLQRFGNHYDQLKVDHGSFIFDDLPKRLTQITNGDLKDLDFRIDSQIDHLLLDEFQDTSRVQWAALQPFAQAIANDASQSKSLFCVGDVKQAIYGWRGGMPEIFDRISTQFEFHESSLDQSFRSAQPVIDTVNAAFKKMHQHESLGTLEMGVNQWCSDFPTHTTARSELAGYSDIRVTAELQEGEKAPTAALRAAVELAAELLQSHPGRSIGLLLRSNDKVASAISQFKQLGVPASEEGGTPLTDSAAVSLICSVLRLADHPGDTAAAFHVCHSPLASPCGLSPDSIHKNSALVSAAATIRQQLLDHGYGKCVDVWGQQLQNKCSEREWNRVQQLVTLAYAHQTTLLPRDFLKVVETEKVTDATSATIRVMTVHQAKGLQFDIVVLGELESSLNHTRKFVAKYDSNTFEAEQVCHYVGREIRSFLPSRYQQMHDDFITRLVNENLCILYVAMTRAVHALHMVLAPTEKLKLTFGGLLRTALCENRPLKPGTIAYQVGDVDWHRNSSSVTPSQERPLKSTVVPSLNIPPTDCHTSSRRLRPTTPSRLEGGKTVRLRPRVSGQFDAMLLGTLFHSWMEQIEWFEEGLPDEPCLRAIASQIGIGSDALSIALADFKKAMKSSSLQRLLRCNSYSKSVNQIWPVTLPSPLEFSVYREQRISVRRQHCLLNGNIDRLIIARHNGKVFAADVIDFKTDRLGSGTNRAKRITESIEYYRPQMLAYRDAVSQMLQLSPERIATRLAFVLENEVTTVGFTHASDSEAIPQFEKEGPDSTRAANASVKRLDSERASTVPPPTTTKSSPTQPRTSQSKQMRLF